MRKKIFGVLVVLFLFAAVFMAAVPVNANSIDERSSEQNDVFYGSGSSTPYGKPEKPGGGNPDTDGDGLRDKQEEKLGTDPNNPDTDGDGLLDGEEVKLYKTDPLNPDTDGGGVNDGDEVANGTDPLDPTDDSPPFDYDNDGLTNDEENNTYGTDWQNPDTDGDGMNDGYEARCGVDVNGWQDPLVWNDRYAVLISGDYATYYDEFWNDIADMYDILVDDYGYKDANIYVLFADGVNKEGRKIVDASATKANIKQAFTDVAAVSDDNDFLYVWTFDHGGTSGGIHATLGVMDGSIQDDDFAQNYVGQVTSYIRRVFTMQQCHSGGFIDDLSNSKTVISTACSFSQVAYRADNRDSKGNYVNEDESGMRHHGEYFFYYQSALHGATPDGRTVNADANGNGYVSIAEVYNFVWDNDSRPETPQYDDNGDGVGHGGSLPNQGDGDLGSRTYL